MRQIRFLSHTQKRLGRMYTFLLQPLWISISEVITSLQYSDYIMLKHYFKVIVDIVNAFSYVSWIMRVFIKFINIWCRQNWSRNFLSTPLKRILRPVNIYQHSEIWQVLFWELFNFAMEDFGNGRYLM